MTQDKRRDEWMDMAEKFGNQLAKGLETFGAQVQKAIESVEDAAANAARPPRGVTVEDQRGAEAGTPASEVSRGEVFEHERALFMRIGGREAQDGSSEVEAVDLANGSVRRFGDDTRVTVVEAKVVVRDRPAS